MDKKIKIGISACLLGENVRYDGDHKQDHFITHTLGPYLEFVPVCPETECGLGVPREPMRLEGTPEEWDVIGIQTRTDYTAKLRDWCDQKLADPALRDLEGFIFKSKSPSCGMERVMVYPPEGGRAVKKGVGIFARAFMHRFPAVPVEDDGRLHDPNLRENFIEMLFTLARWREIRGQGQAIRHLVDFHTRHKLLLLSHSPELYSRMGKIVAGKGEASAADVFDQYASLLLEALKHPATVKKNLNVLLRIMGHFKNQLSSDEKRELLELFDRYRAGQLPLIVPMTLINHYARKYQETYLASQAYLRPHPTSLKLRNHA